MSSLLSSKIVRAGRFALHQYGSANRPIATTPEVEAMLTANAPVAVGVSGGKDSCAVAIALKEHLDAIGHTGPRVLIHSDLGRVEWSDTLPTCRRLAEFLGWELVVVRRKAGDMMDRWRTRWTNNVARYINLQCVKLILPWSTPSMRFCTSEMKTAVICRELILRFPGQSIISVSGVRRDEGRERKNAPIAKPQPKLTSKKHGTVGLDYNPIAEWLIGDVMALLRDRGFELHEAYLKYDASRVSCIFCIMGAMADLVAAAEVPAHLPLLVEMVNLEIESGFAFQSRKWLGDVARHKLPTEMAVRLDAAKVMSERREQVESVIPKHLLYTKGWPTCIPTISEAEILAGVRSEVGELMGFDIKYTTAKEIIARYQQLVDENQFRAVKRPVRKAVVA